MLSLEAINPNHKAQAIELVEGTCFPRCVPSGVLLPLGAVVKKRDLVEGTEFPRQSKNDQDFSSGRQSLLFSDLSPTTKLKEPQDLNYFLSKEWLGPVATPEWLGRLRERLEAINDNKPLAVINVTAKIDAHNDRYFYHHISSDRNEKLQSLRSSVNHDEYVYATVSSADLAARSRYFRYRIIVAKRSRLESDESCLQTNYPNGINYFWDVHKGDGSIMFLFEFSIQPKGRYKHVQWDFISISEMLTGKKLATDITKRFAEFLRAGFSNYPIRAQIAHEASLPLFKNHFLETKGLFQERENRIPLRECPQWYIGKIM